MRNETQETISDIVKEMRRDCPTRHMDGTRYHDGDWVYTKGTVERLADRIEEAMSRNCKTCTWYHLYNDRLLELRRAENDRIRAALRPVLEGTVMSVMANERKGNGK